MMNRIQINKRPVLLFASFAIVCFVLMAYYAFLHERPCSLGYLHDAGVFRVLEYCNALGASHGGQEGAHSKEGYQLESVHVVIRHGDRHSLHGIRNYDRVQVPCTINDDVTQLMPIMTSFKQHMTSQQGRRKDSDTFSDYDVFPNKEKCALADLTPTGAAQHVRNGVLMHKRYFKKLGFKNTKDAYERVLVRSTLWSRCYQSALALTYGFLGNELDVKSLNIEEAADNRMCTSQSGLPCRCDVMENYVDLFAPTYRQIFPEVMDNREMSKVNRHFAQVFDLSIGDVPPVGNLFDASMTHVCHAVPLPAHQSRDDQCVAPWALSAMHDVLAENAKRQAANALLQKISKLKLLPLLTEIKERMTAQARGQSHLKFVLYSGHDTTVGPLTSVLGFGDGTWPPFASRIVLELYRDSNTKSKDKGLFIKVLYNGRNVTPDIEWCKNDIKDNLCPYEVFKQYVESGLLESISEKDYKSACKKHSLSL